MQPPVTESERSGKCCLNEVGTLHIIPVFDAMHHLAVAPCSSESLIGRIAWGNRLTGMNCAVLMARTIGRASSVEARSIVVWSARGSRCENGAGADGGCIADKKRERLGALCRTSYSPCVPHLQP